MNIEMKGIDKSFGSNQVLKNAGFVLNDGEIHALMGENGAGKSTLMKILTGVYTRDAGLVFVDGKAVCFKDPQEAEEAGIVFIYQEINSLFDLTVEENLFMGKEITKGLGIVDKKAMRAKAKEVMDRVGVNIPVDAVMGELSVGQQQMVEICKALMADAKVLMTRYTYMSYNDYSIHKLSVKERVYYVQYFALRCCSRRSNRLR